MQLLSKKNIWDIKEVLIATSDETGSVFLQDYNGKQVTGNMKNG
jgi:hypothetical protein